jgi:phospholipase A2
MAFCCSGGGNRAMIGTMGIFQAAAKAKILQASMYMAGLSGSTWLIAPWSYLYLQGKLNKDFEVSLQQIVQNWITVLNDANMVQAAHGICTPACLKGKQAVNFSKQVALRLAYNEPISAVDLYGAMVGNYALDVVGDDKLKVNWSSIAKNLENADIPLPICSSVFDLNMPSPTVSKEHRQYGWYEFTPFQTGGTEIGYIPAQYLGSRFVKGQLDISPGQLCPEYPLSFILGVCGSAFTLSLDDAVDKGLPNLNFKVGLNEVSLPIDNWVRSVLDEGTENDIRGKRIDNLHARFSNFSMNVPTSVLKNEETFGLFDAGLNFNFPLPVLLDRIDRNIDIVFIYDSNPGDAPAFKGAAAYYKRKKNISVPDMSKATNKSLMTHAMTVFNDPRKKNYDEKIPTFLYFPTRAFDVSKAPYITTNFKYTQEQMEKLINVMDDAFTLQVPEIKKIMQLVAKARHPQK